MGKFFSDDVETALQYIYYDNRLRLHRGQEGFDLLVKASGEGDGDADCIMARCLSGYQYVWPGHQCGLKSPGAACVDCRLIP